MSFGTVSAVERVFGKHRHVSIVDCNRSAVLSLVRATIGQRLTGNFDGVCLRNLLHSTYPVIALLHDQNGTRHMASDIYHALKTLICRCAVSWFMQELHLQLSLDIHLKKRHEGKVKMCSTSGIEMV